MQIQHRTNYCGADTTQASSTAEDKVRQIQETNKQAVKENCSLKAKLGQAVTVLRMYHHKARLSSSSSSSSCAGTNITTTHPTSSLFLYVHLLFPRPPSQFTNTVTAVDNMQGVLSPLRT
jgi:hypothetical protein